MDPLLREDVRRIYAEHFTAQSEADYKDLLDRSQMLADWLVEPLVRSEAAGTQGLPLENKDLAL